MDVVVVIIGEDCGCIMIWGRVLSMSGICVMLVEFWIWNIVSLGLLLLPFEE